jgi:hypothetical protein
LRTNAAAGVLLGTLHGEDTAWAQRQTKHAA